MEKPRRFRTESGLNEHLGRHESVTGPMHRRAADNGAEFIAKKVRAWIGAVGAKTAFITPASPWENGYRESFNARFRPLGDACIACRARDELLNGKVFYSLREAQILIERWRHHCNTIRPHSALRYRPPAPESMMPIDQRPTMHSHSNWTTRWGNSSIVDDFGQGRAPRDRGAGAEDGP
jgi:transposase InsO family protein